MLTALVTLLSFSATPADTYQSAVSSLAAQRVRLASQQGADRIGKAREVLLAAFDDQLFPAWEGTPWDFYGTSQTPRDGKIACGYYVSTLLRDAGFKVERVKLAQQASEKIVKTFAAESDIQRFRNVDPAEVVKQVRAKHGPGLYVVGLDFHAGLLRLTQAGALLCHSAVLRPAYALCEKAETSPGMVSSYHVVGPALSDARIADWLAQHELLTSR